MRASLLMGLFRLPYKELLVAEIDRVRDELNPGNGHLAAELGECK